MFVTDKANHKNCDDCKDPKSPSGRYIRMKADAKRRRLAFKLTIQDIRRYWHEPCSYCGVETPTVNLDRIDSQVGYVPGNVTPCCPSCNHLKGTFRLGDFLSKITAIAEYQATMPMKKVSRGGR